MTGQNLPHIILSNPPESQSYTSTQSGRSDGSNLKERDRLPHGQYLKNRLEQAWAQADSQQLAVAHNARNGTYLEFVSDPSYSLALESLEDLRKNIRLVNVRKISHETDDAIQEQSSNETTLATVFVPNSQKMHFLKKIEQYLTQDTSTNKPRNQALLNNISDIRKVLSIEPFWVDAGSLMPSDNQVWTEIWLRDDGGEILANFDNLLRAKGLEFKDGYLRFPERLVKLVKANKEQLIDLSNSSDFIAEFRAAKTTSSWMGTSNRLQAIAVDELLDRTVVNADNNSVVCILDTGINNQHPLITPVLHDDDCLAVNESWGTNDHDKHGTLMAGAVLFGDINQFLNSNENIILSHKLESVKLLPPPPDSNPQNLWGYLTSQAISIAEINGPKRNRVVCMAVTADGSNDRGRPTSWSAELDQLSSGALDDKYRLILVSSGNTTATICDAAYKYPLEQLTDSVQDPAQSWNALSVGAYTELDTITDPSMAGYCAVAPKQGLSPFTTTSLTWDENKWPIKPELILEGGNLAKDNSGFATESDELSILSTFFKPRENHFYPFSMTSAATASLAGMAGKLQASNPNLWPETIRALLVHSAYWPEKIKQQFLQNQNKSSYKRLLSICGYGVPNLEKALFSATNRLTLITEQTIKPFCKRADGSGYRTNEMHIHELPWPKNVLLGLPFETKVEMRITLSYFVEPGPGEVGGKDRYRYASHGLRFELTSPNENIEDFKKRINKAARHEDEGRPNTSSPSEHWLLGSQARDRGSIHSDIWRGTAQELAASNLIAITPTIGWWRERAYLGKWDKEARYALIVSISTPDESIDLYTPVAVQVGLPTPVTIEI